MTPPAWHPRPTQAGLWIWFPPGGRPAAWIFSDEDARRYKAEAGAVFGPVKDQQGKDFRK